MSFMWNVILVIIALVIVRVSKWLWQWSNPNSGCNGKLPPGSMGFPIIGETMDLFKPCGLLENLPFLEKRMLKYGSLFKTNLLGSKTVISTDADVIHEVLRQENESFVHGYPDIFVKVVGKDNLFLKGGNIHKHIKQTTLHLLGSEGLKRKMIGSMNQTTRELLRLKASQGPFDLRDSVSSMIVSYMTTKLISNLDPETRTEVIDTLKMITTDLMQNFFAPSTWKNLNKVHKARKEATKALKEALQRRKESRVKQGDFLDTLLEETEKEGSPYDHDSIIAILIFIGFVSKDTTSFASSVAVNFISKNPKVLAELKVINEAVRLSNLGTILFRKAVKDVEIKGYTIPAGWIVAVAPSVVHFNSEIYENPFDFNPWRWEGKDLRSGSKTFMVFGGGMRQCAGADFAKVQLSLFLHHLVTTYDFSVVQECEVIRSPYARFSKELLISIIPKSPK